MCKSVLVYVICVILVLSYTAVRAVSLEDTSVESADAIALDKPAENVTQIGVAVTPTITEGVVASVPVDTTQDLNTSDKEDNDKPFVGTVGAVAIPDNVAVATDIDPAIYAGVLSPEAFQQYVNQYGAAGYIPYGPPAYPSPVGYPHPPTAGAVYPSPYLVQTGYEGYLVPSTTTTTTTTTTGSSTTASSADDSNNSIISQLNPLTVLTNLFPSLMMSTIFRVLASIVTIIGVIFFGGAITTAICNYTPICDISFRTVSYLRNKGTAEEVGRMIADEMTPERVRRATAFVRNAIRKYRELQKLLKEERALES